MLKPYQLTLPYIKNNYVYLSFLGVFLLINITLFVSRAIQFRESNYCVIFARACGRLKKKKFICQNHVGIVALRCCKNTQPGSYEAKQGAGGEGNWSIIIPIGATSSGRIKSTVFRYLCFLFGISRCEQVAQVTISFL